jgi:hypothetical protein
MEELNIETKKLFFPECILCGDKLSRTTPPEHIIPDYLGGRIKAIILCDKCNHGVGASLYSQFKFDHFIRQSGLILKDIIPDIHKNIELSQRYVSKSPTGTVISGIRRKNGVVLSSGIQADNSFVLPTKNTAPYLHAQLNGVSPVDNIKNIIYDTPNKTLKILNEKLSFVRWDIETVTPDFSKNKPIEERAAILMAYEYLSLIVGQNIYSDAFKEVRELINSEIDSSKLIEVEQLTSKIPQPFHRIYPEYLEDRIIINIWLFEYVVYKVIFKQVTLSKIDGNEVPYLEDLENKKSLVAKSVAEAKNKHWYEYTNY